MKQRPFCDMRPSMKSNVMLVRHKVGKVADSTYDLPPSDYRYGYQAHDDHGVAECLKWDGPSSKLDASRRKNSPIRRKRSRSPSPPPTQAEQPSSDYYSSAAAQRSRNMRTQYDGYDPRNLDKSQCTSRVDPDIVNGKMRVSRYDVGSSLYESDKSASIYDKFKHRSRSGRPPVITQQTAKEAITSPSRFKQKTTTKEIGKTDFIETNKQALKDGCVTASEYREYKQNHKILVKPEENIKAQEDEYLRYKVKNMIHGIPTPVNSEMKECLTWQGYKDAKAKALRKRARDEAKKSQKASGKLKGIRHTKASRGHSYKPDPPPSYADTFKIKRFKDIDRYAIVDYW